MKTTFKSLLGALVVLAAVTSCAKESLNPIDIKTGETTVYTVNGGSSVDIPFQLLEVNGAAVVSNVVCSKPDAKVSVVCDDKGGIITVEVDDCFADEQFTVKLIVTDSANNRDASKTFTINEKANGRKIAEYANTFVCTPGELVLAPLSKGNSGVKIAADSVVLTWQDSIIVSSISFYKDMKTDVMVEFNEGQVGNALLSAYQGGSIVWNWTFWVIADQIKTVTVTDTLSKEPLTVVSYEFMDRCIGATGTTVGTPATIGNNYQWGRPVPMPGGNYDGVLRTLFGETIKDTVSITVTPVAVLNNIENGIKNPTTHYSGVGGGNYSWVTNDYKQVDSATVVGLWGGDKKSQYDPCPAGWRVASEDAWKAVGKATEKVKVDGTGAATTVNKDVRAWKYIWANGTEFIHYMAGETPHGGNYTSGIGGKSTWPCGKVWSRSFDPSYKVGGASSYFRARSTSQSPSSNSVSGGLGLGYAINVRCVLDK